MKKTIASLALLTVVGMAKADVTVLFPNGDFDSPAGAKGPWVEVGGGVGWNYPTNGGNPNGYGVMTDSPAPSWGIWVGGDSSPLPIAPMGLVAGGTYNFVQDMKILSGANIGGIKVESWGPAGILGNSGDMRPASGSGTWETYPFSYTLEPGTTGLKIVPLWGGGSSVAYDNIGVVVPPQALIAEISSPTEGATNSNVAFTIEATATVSPAVVTNVSFYDGATLLGSDSVFPYTFTYTGATIGNHALHVVANDNTGTSATSATVNIVVADLAPPPPNYPTNNAPTPIWPAVMVKSLKNSSGTYTDKTGINWYAQWGSTTIGANYTITNTGRVVLGYKGLTYEGIELDPTYAIGGETDLSAANTMHVDLWTTADQFGIKFVTETIGTAGTKFEAEYRMDDVSGLITSNHWVSLDIPLSTWTDLQPSLNLSKLIQMLWTDNFGAGVQKGNFYIDNVFFYNNTPVIQSPAHSGTDFTCKVASLPGYSYVLQGSPSLAPTTWTGLQTNAGTGGMLNFTVPITGANPQRYFRIHTQ